MKRGKMIAALAALGLMLVAGAAQAVPISSVGSGFWTNPASWSPAQVPVGTDDVIIASGSTNTISTNVALAIASLTIQTNGVLTHLANGATLQGELYKVILNIAGNLTIDAGGQINADGKGYSANNGPGKPPGTAGAGHGGIGGNRATDAGTPGTTYGLITAPTNIGSGANYAGGGAVLLVVNGTTTLNGAISAGGFVQPGAYVYGSGGSVFLTTGTLTGDGTLRANGGSGGWAGGGGGRVAVILTNSADVGNVKMQAYSGGDGAGGTVYLQTTNHTPGHGKLIVDYNDIAPGKRGVGFTLQNGVDASSYVFSEIVLTNGGVYALDTNDTLDITGTTIHGDSADGYDGIYLAGGTLVIPTVFSFSNVCNCFLAIGATNTPFNPTSLTVGSNATMRIDVPWTLNCPVTVAAGGVLNHSGDITNYPAITNLTINGNMDIQTNGTVNANTMVVNGNLNIQFNGVLTHAANSTTALGEPYKLILSVSKNLTIDCGGAINANSKGYGSGASGPGKSMGNNSGAQHGGHGGHRATDAFIRGTIYGSITAPTNCGSSGNGAGGGAIRVSVTGTTTVNGAISAMGGAASYATGAGGSVFLTTGTLLGSGTISVNGGASDYGSGGGGRIAVVLTNSADFAGVTMQAFAGTIGGQGGPGAPGTVYLETSAQGFKQGNLIVDGNNITPPDPLVATLITSNVTDTVVGTVILTNKAIFQIDTNQSLTVNGSWLMGTNTLFIASSNSTVIFAGTNTATILGTNTFCNLTAGAAGKTILFEASKTNNINGMLIFQNFSTLMSTVDGTQWGLNLVSPGGTQLVGRVTVKDSNANGGQKINAARYSIDLLNNLNWFFIPLDGSVIVVR